MWSAVSVVGALAAVALTAAPVAAQAPTATITQVQFDTTTPRDSLRGVTSAPVTVKWTVAGLDPLVHIDEFPVVLTVERSTGGTAERLVATAPGSARSLALKVSLPAPPATLVRFTAEVRVRFRRAGETLANASGPIPPLPKRREPGPGVTVGGAIGAPPAGTSSSPSLEAPAPTTGSQPGSATSPADRPARPQS